MSEHRFSHETLNAFVDGALPPAQAAAVIAAIAEDPNLARHVATLHRLKSAVTTLNADTPLPPLPAPLDRRRPVWRGAIAAAILGAAIGGALWFGAPQHTGPDAAVSAALSPLATHQAWADTAHPQAQAQMPDDLEWLTPVMHATGLHLAYAGDWQNGLHLGYIGANACKLSLFIQPDDQPDTALDIHLDQHLQQASWTISGLHFSIVSLDMDTARFATIATTAHTKSRDHLPASAAQIALINAARLPCLA
ncbi:hypothetical protein [Roseinatronobacter sp. S2]|uniref:hypothetical protein n=1 Tax=Roseinatronobacter sp. S2 TaxID=3035471 RepID=UPI00240EC4AE|nr:hypothetical protein [Roseinatronobacter sp. S2]WFE74850.1 hypothetical protein P8S53_00185 [Roseinatronobacter sp. S2]